MFIAYDETLEVHPQSEGFTEHQLWDFDKCRPDQYPLLLNFPYFDLYRKQVVKQADLVLALFWCGDSFTAEEKVRDFDYYEPLTVRDSSLSACTQAIMAAEVGHLDLAYDYFAEAALMDLDDLEHNTRDGIHIASVAGTWIAAVAGFGGMRDHGGKLSFTPRLPGGAHPPALPDHVPRPQPARRGRPRSTRATRCAAASRWRSSHHGETVTVTGDETLELADPARITPRGDLRQPPGREPARRGAGAPRSAERADSRRQRRG